MSYLSWIYPSGKLRKKGYQRILVRVIEYTIEHPETSQEKLTYRLITSLLDIEQFPAELLAREYHQRWRVRHLPGFHASRQVTHSVENTIDD